METKEDNEHPEGTQNKASRNRHRAHQPHHKSGQALTDVITKGANQQHRGGHNDKQANRRYDNNLQVLVNDALKEAFDHKQQRRAEHGRKHRRGIAHNNHRKTQEAAHIAVATECSKVGLQKRSAHSGGKIRIRTELASHGDREDNRQEIENGVGGSRQNRIRAGIGRKPTGHGADGKNCLNNGRTAKCRNDGREATGDYIERLIAVELDGVKETGLTHRRALVRILDGTLAVTGTQRGDDVAINAIYAGTNDNLILSAHIRNTQNAGLFERLLVDLAVVDKVKPQARCAMSHMFYVGFTTHKLDNLVGVN